MTANRLATPLTWRTSYDHAAEKLTQNPTIYRIYDANGVLIAEGPNAGNVLSLVELANAGAAITEKAREYGTVTVAHRGGEQ